MIISKKIQLHFLNYLVSGQLWTYGIFDIKNLTFGIEMVSISKEEFFGILFLFKKTNGIVFK